jgi:cytidylate kinase
MRDKKDGSREDSPLRIAADAKVIDTTNLTIEESVEAILDLIESRDSSLE